MSDIDDDGESVPDLESLNSGDEADDSSQYDSDSGGSSDESEGEVTQAPTKKPASLTSEQIEAALYAHIEAWQSGAGTKRALKRMCRVCSKPTNGMVEHTDVMGAAVEGFIAYCAAHARATPEVARVAQKQHHD